MSQAQRAPRARTRRRAIGADPRAVAAGVVEAVCEGGATLADALASVGDALLEPRDAALARAIARATVRRRGDIDWCLSRLMERPLPRRAGEARSILRSAAAQLLFMRQAEHAAVNVAVALLKASPAGGGFAGLANAVLRRLVGERDGLLARLPVEANTPGWLWRRWVGSWGEATAAAIAAAHREEPALDLAFAGPDVSRPADATALPTGGARVPRGDVTAMEGYAEGGWWVQDVAAQLPVTLFGDVAGRTVLDLCAAPGGKAMQLAAAGARVTALEVDEARAVRLSQNLARTRMGDRVQVVVGDARAATGRYDAVLLDAPCSATGTLRRQPDAAWAKSAADVAALAGLQRDLLRRAADCLAPGGMLVFATCSIEPEEGEAHLAFVREALPGLAPEPVAEGPAATFATSEGTVRTLPHMVVGDGGPKGLDGFFAARFRAA
ncbi:RsmB/NOP family class I SAM-dependent RNA methyltransferase [Acuticoccus sp.]|uniref:RsmB/NOP family class I SAM-dependent RNA methyltransferase n=1 Tax=Acuticoccus sp. TaxID=1904378 RepID=UPI003B52B742